MGSLFARKFLTYRYRIALFLIIILYTNNCLAWNAATHKIIAEIAWQSLEPDRRILLTELLRHHPRYRADLQKNMPENYAGTSKQAKWVFRQAAVWPDQIINTTSQLRSLYHQPGWHYINFPKFIDNQVLSTNENLSPHPDRRPVNQYNIVQALHHNVEQINSHLVLPEQKAIALCWILHLVGDIHQPLHAASLYNTEIFPNGDRGGNLVRIWRTTGATNLHRVWDSVLGRAQSPRQIEQKARHLLNRPINGKLVFDPYLWARQSHQLARKSAYRDDLLMQIQQQSSHRKQRKIKLDSDYIRQARIIARQQSLLAGLRAAKLLRQIAIHYPARSNER